MRACVRACVRACAYVCVLLIEFLLRLRFAHPVPQTYMSTMPERTAKTVRLQRLQDL